MFEIRIKSYQITSYTFNWLVLVAHKLVLDLLNRADWDRFPVRNKADLWYKINLPAL